MTGVHPDIIERNYVPETVLRAVTAAEFLAFTFPPREYVLEPVIPSQGLTLVYAPRGTGKTHVSLGAGYAVASGGQFLRWKAPKPRKTLFVDGEMPGVTLQERLASLAANSEQEPPEPGNLRIITPDLQNKPLSDLATAEGQAAIEEHLDGVEFLVLDNISTLCRTGKENESESWLPVQEWLLKLRRRGISVLLIHHAGKGGQQRGTSRREDVLDTVIALRRPGDYEPSQGARFEVHFEKSRGVHGDAVKPFEARLEQIGERIVWSTKDVEESRTEQVARLLSDGVPQKEIAELLGIAKGTVSKHAKRVRELRLVVDHELD